MRMSACVSLCFGSCMCASVFVLTCVCLCVCVCVGVVVFSKDDFQLLLSICHCRLHHIIIPEVSFASCESSHGEGLSDEFYPCLKMPSMLPLSQSTMSRLGCCWDFCCWILQGIFSDPLHLMMHVSHPVRP